MNHTLLFVKILLALFLFLGPVACERVPISEISKLELLSTGKKNSFGTTTAKKGDDKWLKDSLSHTCPLPLDIHLEWATHVGASIISTPRIVDLHSDGYKEILIPTYDHYFEALNGLNGEEVDGGFPLLHRKLKSYSSPLPIDMNGDGRMDWLIGLYSGELLVLTEESEVLGVIQLPPLAMKKNWVSKNISISNVARMHTVQKRQMGAGSEEDRQMLEEIMRARSVQHLRFRRVVRATVNEDGKGPMDNEGEWNTPSQRRTEKRTIASERSSNPDLRPTYSPGNAEMNTFESLQKIEDTKIIKNSSSPLNIHEIADFPVDEKGVPSMTSVELEQLFRSFPQLTLKYDQWSDEAKRSLQLLYPPIDPSSASLDENAADDSSFSFKLLRSPLWSELAEDEIAVDAHILSTPVIVDIDKKGDMDIIVHVSYFFDPDEYLSNATVNAGEGGEGRLHSRTLPVDIKPEEYIATALLCFNIVTGELRWSRVVDVTTTSDIHPSYALSSPLVLNGDAHQDGLEIYLTTTSGRILGFNADGEPLPEWSHYLGPITGSPVSEWVLGPTSLNQIASGPHICAGGASGVVACFNTSGGLLWETVVEGVISDQITFGDINGDGILDLVFGTSAGLIYALHGTNGTIHRNFPVKTNGPIVAPALLINLDSEYTESSGKAVPLHIVIPSHDGNLYVVDGREGCVVSTVHVGEKSSTMVLADDITGNGKVDLLLTSLQGGVFVFEAPAAFHPNKRWASKVKGVNGVAASENGIGVFITPPFRQYRDIQGAVFFLELEIQDWLHYRRPNKASFVYTIDIFIGPRIQVYHGIFRAPGKHLLRLRSPLQNMYATIMVVMTTPEGLTYADELSMSFNMKYLAAVKYTLIMPFLVCSFGLMLIRKRHLRKQNLYSPQHHPPTVDFWI